MGDRVKKTDAEWRDALTEQQYEVCRRRDTEPAFSGAYWDCKDDGRYCCACCGAELFRSSEKFDSGTGWPSFKEAAGAGTVNLSEDLSHGMRRVEVSCARCDAHLGHVFDDGPTGERYCINSVALDLNRD